MLQISIKAGESQDSTTSSSDLEKDGISNFVDHRDVQRAHLVDPMHNTNSPVASLRLAWFSPIAVGMARSSRKVPGTSITPPPARRKGRSDRLGRRPPQGYH